MNPAPPRCLPLLLLVAAATAQAPSLSRGTPVPLATPSGVLIDEPHADGVFWVRGDTYKARVDRNGVSYMPRFPTAQSHTPIQFRYGDAADGKVVRDGKTFRIQHSRTLVEQWEPRAQGMEQRFVLTAAPTTSDLVLAIDVATDLQYHGYNRGLVFRADGLGDVVYGEGIVFDAAGQRAPIVPEFEPSRPGHGCITLRVAASFLANARYPVTIDPLVSTFGVATSTASQFHPDIARDAALGDFVVVYESQFNAGDHDIFSQRFAADGTFLNDIVFDVTADTCLTPKICATQSGTNVIAIWDNDGSAKGIQARAHRLSLIASDPVAQVTADGVIEDCRDPDIGAGNLVSVNNLGQMAVFVRRTAGVNFSLRGLQIQSNGRPAASGEFIIDSAPGCDPRPDISPSGGTPLHWAVVWQKNNTLCTNADIWWAPVNLGGLIQPAAALESGAGDELEPRVFTDRSETMFAWREATTSFGADLAAVVLVRSGNNFTQVGPKVVLSAAEPGVPRAADQFGIALGFDGCRHSYAYLENQHPRAACVTASGGLYIYSEGHVSLTPTTNNCGAMAMTHVPSAESPVRYAAVWQENMGSHFDVRGAFYDGRAAAGGVATVQTGCGRTQTGISAAGVPVLGHDFDVSLGNVAGVPIILVGPPNAPITLCGTLLPCQLGVFPIVVSVPGAQLRTTVPCNPFLIGGQLAFQGIDVNAPLGCSATQTGVALRTTDTLVVTFQ